MEICRVCWSCSSICDCGDEAIYEEAGYCESCGTIDILESLEESDGFCNDCEEERLEDREGKVELILANLGNLLD